MKYLTLLSAFIIAPLSLTGCDSEQARKERCTEIQDDATDIGMGRKNGNQAELKKEWDSLECRQRDIIRG